MSKSKFLKKFKERGFLQQCTDETALDEILYKAEQSGSGLPVYIGFDCTATSLHVGSLLQIMILRLLQQCGHKPIVLLGGATTKIGDPSGKDESRPVLTDEAIAKNLAGIRAVIEKFIDFEGKFDGKTSKAFLVNNEDWMSKLSSLELINIAGHFSVNKMLTFDSVKLRLERDSHLSLKEFLYMIVQAYDFVELNKKYGCRLQIGGSDQWGNIVNGIDLHASVCERITEEKVVNWNEPPPEGEDGFDCLLRNVPDLKNDISNIKGLAWRVSSDFDNQSTNLRWSYYYPILGLTTPLIATASGAKMGKTADGAVWLSEDRVKPYDYWQFWRNSDDKDVGRFLRLFTELPVAEIEKLERLEGAEINKAKIVLANEATKICHGEAAARLAEDTARKVFEQGVAGDALPETELAKSELDAGVAVYKLFVDAGLAESNKAAKRLIQGGGARINDEKVTDETAVIGLDSAVDGVIKLSAGKKKYALVRIRV